MSDHAQIFRGLLWTIPSTLTTQTYCRCYPDKICLPQKLPKQERSGKSFHNRMSSFSMLNTPILNPGINTALFSLASDLLSLGKGKWTYKVLKGCIVAPSTAFRWSWNNPFTVAKNKSRYEYHKLEHFQLKRIKAPRLESTLSQPPVWLPGLHFSSGLHVNMAIHTSILQHSVRDLPFCGPVGTASPRTTLAGAGKLIIFRAQPSLDLPQA